MARIVVLDTETTGMNQAGGDVSIGHDIIEIGAIELENRRYTGRKYHQYIKPTREVDPEALAVHGITDEFLADKPVFSEICDEFVEFIRGAELVIHNASFDVSFMNAELNRIKYGQLIDDLSFKVTDSLLLARRKHPGQKNNLDALCRRYEIDNSARTLHGALLDAEILADVYLALTGGQTRLHLDAGEASNEEDGATNRYRVTDDSSDLAVVLATVDELEQHQTFLKLLAKKSGDNCVWLTES